MKSSVFLALISALFLALFAIPASAQATRTWVSGVGDDANPCSRTAPCKTFAGAISKTATKGEINCLDPGGFGAVTITKSISIICGETGTAGVLVSGTNAIVVSVGATDNVLLEGLDFDGLGTGLNGVNIIGGGNTTIRKSTIQGFSLSAVNLIGSTNARVFVDDCVILNNTQGVNLDGGNGGGLTVTGFVRNTLIDSNPNFALRVATGSTAVLIGSTLTGSNPGISFGGGTVLSYGNNVIRNSNPPSQTLPLQ